MKRKFKFGAADGGLTLDISSAQRVMDEELANANIVNGAYS